MILLDTDIFIDLFRNYKPAVDFFGVLQNKYAQDEILFSAVTEAELIAGDYCNNEDYRERTLHVLSLFNKIIIDNRIAVLSGDIKRKFGQSLPDAIIAASALNNNAALMTRNIKDFEKISGLKVEKPY